MQPAACSEKMAVIGAVGRIIATDYLQAMMIEWEITDFFSLSSRVGDCFRSNVINFAGSSWHLGLFPNGAGPSKAGWLALVLIRMDSGGKPRTVFFAFGIKGSGGAVDWKKERNTEFSPDRKLMGHPKCWSREELRNRASTLMPNNKLTIICHLGCHVAAEGGEKAVAEDLVKLLSGGEGSDVTVEAGGVEFPVHSAILYARCPALSASLKHESKEKSSRRIVVEDCEADVFRDFLHHLYSGSPKHLSRAINLYRVADKYLVDDLKQHCLEHIRRTLSVESFCDTMKLALMHGESDLFQRAVDFATRNIESIVCSGDWQNFIREHPTEANEIFIKSIPVLRDNKKDKA